MRPATLRSLRLSRPSTSALRRFSVSPSALSPAAAASSSPQPYSPPLQAGVLPAYDLALEYLRDTAVSNRAAVPALEEEIASLTAQLNDRSLGKEDRLDLSRDLVRLRRRVWQYKGGADRFDPQVRHEFTTGLANASTDSFRYLDQERFELGGTLDVHVQRLNLMHVVPDVCDVGRAGLTLDLALRFPAPPPAPKPVPDEYGWIKSKSDRVVKVREEMDGDRVIVGSMLTVGETRPQPEVEVRYWGAEKTYGTLVMVDPDVPNPDVHGFSQKLHWLVPNVPLSSATRIFPSPSFDASTSRNQSSLPDALVPYLPPHPHKGSPSYHRYTFALITHPEQIKFDAIKDLWETKTFNFRALQAGMAAQLGKRRKEVAVSGLTFVRSVYNEVECSKIWQEVIKEKEVKFRTPRASQQFWVADSQAKPLNALFKRPTAAQKALSLKARNKALLFNQELGVVAKGPDKNLRFVSTDEWKQKAAVEEDVSGDMDKP